MISSLMKSQCIVIYSVYLFVIRHYDEFSHMSFKNDMKKIQTKKEICNNLK